MFILWLLDQHYCMVRSVGLSRSLKSRRWRLLRCGWFVGFVVTRLDMIRNVVIRDKVGVTSIEEKMREVW